MEMTEEDAQAGTNKVELGLGVTYGQYLQVSVSLRMDSNRFKGRKLLTLLSKSLLSFCHP